MRKSEKGSALILVVTLSTLLLLAATAASLSSISNIGLSDEQRIKVKLEYACESALNRARAKIEDSYNNDNLTELEPFVSFSGGDEDNTTLTPEEKAYNDEEFLLGSGSESDYYSYTLAQDEENNRPIYVKYAISLDEETGADPNYRNGWIRGQAYTTQPLKIEAIAYSPGFGWVGMKEKAASRRSTLFMYNIFFEDELEIIPGPNFSLRGLIHTNDDLYLSANNTLSIYTDSLTSAGEAFRRRYNNTTSGGTVKISSENEEGSLLTMNRSPREDSTNSDWVSLATDKWKGSFRDKHLGATRLEAPDLKSIEPGGFYDNNAGLNIKVISNSYYYHHTYYYYTSYEITYNGTTTLSNADLNNALSETTMYDRRESTSKQVNVTQIDIEKLASSPYWPENGLIYMTRDDAVKDNDGNPYSPDPNRVISGFKLKNGEELPQATTFVTNLPAWVQGDFNMHTSENPLSDKWQPCALVADAISILSKSWQDGQSSSKRNASSTTYNLVFITGNVPTNPSNGQYSGGLENFPRMLENWNGDTLTIKGGLMQLFRSQYATGNWSGSYYDPPNRKWSSEERFENLEDFPPMFTGLFPSTNMGIVYSSWSKMNKHNATLIAEE